MSIRQKKKVKRVKIYNALPNSEKFEEHHTSPEAISLKRKEHFKDDYSNSQQLGMITEEIKARLIRTKNDLYHIGKLLTEAKQIVGHGEFQNWVQKNFDFRYSTANNMMNVYACCAGNPDVVSKIKTSILYKVSSKSFPEELRKFILDNADILEDIDNETIVDISQKFASGKANLESKDIKALLKYTRENDEEKFLDAEAKKCIEILKKTYELLQRTAENFKWPVLNGNKIRTERVYIKDIIAKMNKEIKNLASEVGVATEA